MGWLESARRFADAVVALDDGSTDETAFILADDPLVRILLHVLGDWLHVGVHTLI